jgi:uncharacterized C2H2 Zn-finger protein
MTQYSCNKCGKIFKQKNDHRRHVNKKIACVKVDHIPCENQDNMIQTPHKSTKFHKTSTQKPQNSTQNNEKDVNGLKCNYCQKSFARSDSLNRHIKTYCRVRKNQNDEKELLDKLLEEMRKQNGEMQRQREEIDKLKEINQVITQNQHSNNNNNNNNNNNIQINNNNIQNQQNNNNIQINNNNIKILSFGKEDVSHITNDIYKNILRKGMGSLPSLIEYIHFNKNKPENHNVYISNIRSNYAIIYDNVDWKLKDQKEVLEILFDKMDILEEKHVELSEELTEATKDLLREIFEGRNEQEINNEIRKRIKLLLYNKKEIPERTRELANLETDNLHCLVSASNEHK